MNSISFRMKNSVLSFFKNKAFYVIGCNHFSIFLFRLKQMEVFLWGGQTVQTTCPDTAPYLDMAPPHPTPNNATRSTDAPLVSNWFIFLWGQSVLHRHSTGLFLLFQFIIYTSMAVADLSFILKVFYCYGQMPAASKLPLSVMWL